MTLGDGEMATPVLRGYCVCFWQEPILAKTRYSGRKMGEFVYLFVLSGGRRTAEVSHGQQSNMAAGGRKEKSRITLKAG